MVGRFEIGQQLNSMNIVYSLISIHLLISSCNLFDAGSEKEEFEPTFKAEINGELFDISLKEESFKRFDAVLTNQANKSFLAIYADFYSMDLYPYREQVGFTLFWDQSIIEYDSKRDSTLIGQYYLPSGGTYYEADGDALISTFNSPVNDQGIITVNIETLNDGRKFAFGNFEFSVVTRYPLNEPSQRIGQDTLKITNGEYRLLLDERRE